MIFDGLQLLKAWTLTLQPGDDPRKQVGLKTFVRFGENSDFDAAFALKLPDNEYEIKGMALPFTAILCNVPLSSDCKPFQPIYRFNRLQFG